jgi:hypothetical protein
LSVAHHAQTETIVDLDGTVDTLTVGALAERALATAGPDAELLLRPTRAAHARHVRARAAAGSHRRRFV